MTREDKITYKKLQRQCGEAHRKLYDIQNGKRLKINKPNLFNNRLKRMQDFLSNINYGDYSSNRWMSYKPEI